MSYKSFRVLLFIILNMNFTKFLDQMGSPSLRAFPGLFILDKIQSYDQTTSENF
jgi:hypothetical protein